MVFAWEQILEGPRGRELCLQAALAVEARECSDGPWPLWSALLNLDGPSVSAMYFEGDGVERRSAVERFRVRLASISPSPLGDEEMRKALGETVGAARYWQEPEPHEAVLGLPEVQAVLRPWVESFERNPNAQWWLDGLDLSSQFVAWGAQMGEKCPFHSELSARQRLIEAAREEEDAEHRSAKERFLGPDKVSAGAWWSIPQAHHSTRLWPASNVPVAAYAREDANFEPEDARWVRLTPPAKARVLELTPKVWVELCRRYPMAATYSRRGTWFDWSGRDGEWVIPNWAHAANEWDAVHLPVSEYLSSAGRVLPVDGEFATAIAGWSPDETYWLTDVAHA